MSQNQQKFHDTAPEGRVNPGRSLGIAGFVLSILGPLSIVGLILSIVALVQSRRAGFKNGFALAGIIIAAVMIVVGLALIIFGFTTLLDTCAELGSGVHERNGVTYTCNV